MAICSTTSNKRLTASEVQVGADGFLYTQTGYQVSRYTLNHLHSPVNYLEKNNNILADSISNDMYIQGAAFAGIGTKGFAVSRNGNMAFQDRHGIALYDTTGKLLKDLIVSPMLITAAALRFDPAGFLYVGGGRCYPTSMNTPVNYSSETSYLNATGVIAKFDVTSVNKGGFTSSQVNNALTVYTNAGIGPYSADPGNSCICRSPRFDIDAFGRLFVPNGISGKVRVVDNTNNLLMEFGDYGNADSKGSDSYIPLFMPMTAAATDDYIYVSDDVNVRLIRVKIDYVLDNIPTFLGTLSVNRLGTKLEKKHAYILTATPNPFNPICAISVDMSTNHYVTQQNAEHITLAIYSADGRLIRILADGLNQTGKFIWDGRDMRNQIATAGLYVVRFSAGQQITSKKIVLAK
ncbi:MAG: T9SS type A sorting domain-containing protein [Fibrobacteres bacterium]|nr:T9SS type A sorting domain-containing protein [Fibrobacterota bacterium]